MRNETRVLVGFWLLVLGVNDTGQKRGMFIQTQSTPNPSSLMFYPGKPIMEVGSADFPNARSAMSSPLAKALYGIDGKDFFHYYVLYSVPEHFLFV